MSPRGIAGIQAAKADIEKRKASGGGGNVWFKLADGEEAQVRFLEQGDELAFAWCHELPKEPNELYPRLVVCRDQANNGSESCPGCEKQYKKRFRGWINMIQRDAPIRVTDKDGKWIREGNGYKTEGTADQLVIWNTGIEVFDNLVHLDGHYKGLMSRDYTIKRSGEKLETKWHMLPEDPSPLSEEDLALAENKADLDRYITPQSYEEWGVRKSSSSEEGSGSSGQAESPFKNRRSPFAKPNS